MKHDRCRCDAADTDAPLRTNQKIYARGRFDGLRLAGIDQPETFMRVRKLIDAEASLNSVARKILEACPKSEAWTLSRISAELQRQGCNPGMQVVEGCIRQARELGLVKENATGGMWQRVHIDKPEPSKPMESDGKVTPLRASSMVADSHIAKLEETIDGTLVKSQEYRDADPLERLGFIAHLARTMSHALGELADTIDDAAIDYTDRMQRNDENSGKLKQLRDLLADLAK